MEVNPVAMETNATNYQGYNTVWKFTYNKNTILEFKLIPTTIKRHDGKSKTQREKHNGEEAILEMHVCSGTFFSLSAKQL